jgi:hypothetical protein
MRWQLWQAPVTPLVLALLLGACHGSSPAPDTARQAASDASLRLEGQWTLVEFQPAQPLDPLLSGLLAAQLNQLVVSFHGGTLTAHGMGVDASREYRVTQAAADGFSALVIDPTNVAYRVTGAFQGPDLWFNAETDPWRGRGRLRRN